MFTVFLTTLEQMLKIMLYLLLGFGINRLHILPENARASISRLITVILLPALLLYSNMTEFNLTDIGNYGQLVLFGGLFWGAITLLCLPVVKKLSGGKHPERGIFLYGLSFSNSGAVGTPLVLALLGTAGLFRFNLFLLVASIMTYAWGIGLFLPMERKNHHIRFLINLLNPVCISLLIGLALGALGAKNWMPALITNSLKDLSACYAPLSLLLSGYTIADYPLMELFRRPKSYLFAFLRLICIPLLTLAAAWLLGLPKTIAILVTLFFAAPSGLNVVVFPAAYGQDCLPGASIVLVSSIGSLLTLPLLYALTQILFG